MIPVLEPSELGPYLAPRHDPARWSCIIAAAGRGSRLGFDKPKILFPVAGRTILEHLSRLLEPFCESLVFVLSPSGEPHVAPELGARAKIALQQEPLGMGHAVRCGLTRVTTEFAMVVWGDQVALRPQTIEHGARLLAGPGRPAAVCPTVWRERPYIHFDRDPRGRMNAVRQAREGDEMPARGESDTGLFLFRSDRMRSALEQLRAAGNDLGPRTQEQNFLPVLPWLDQQDSDGVCSPRIAGADESLGVNSLADVEVLEEYFRTRAIKP